jgi:hypothetical protein
MLVGLHPMLLREIRTDLDQQLARHQTKRMLVATCHVAQKQRFDLLACATVCALMCCWTPGRNATVVDDRRVIVDANTRRSENRVDQVSENKVFLAFALEHWQRWLLCNACDVLAHAMRHTRVQHTITYGAAHSFPTTLSASMQGPMHSRMHAAYHRIMQW